MSDFLKERGGRRRIYKGAGAGRGAGPKHTALRFMLAGGGSGVTGAFETGSHFSVVLTGDFHVGIVGSCLNLRQARASFGA